jgi:hypothetical protein
VSYLGVNLSSILGLFWFPLSLRGISYSVEIDVEGYLSHALVIGLLLPYS